MSAVRSLLERYLQPCLDTLNKLTRKEINLDKEDVLRNIRQVYRVVYGSSELLAPIPVNIESNLSNVLAETDICSPSTVETIEQLIISLDKENVRLQVMQVITLNCWVIRRKYNSPFQYFYNWTGGIESYCAKLRIFIFSGTQ